MLEIAFSSKQLQKHVVHYWTNRYSKSNLQSCEGTEAATFPRGWLDGFSSPIVDPVSSMAASANQPGDLVPALTTALTAALVTLQKPTPVPVPRGGRIKLGCYDGLTSWETYCSQFELLATANEWSPAERAVQLVSIGRGGKKSTVGCDHSRPRKSTSYIYSLKEAFWKQL